MMLEPGKKVSFVQQDGSRIDGMLKSVRTDFDSGCGYEDMEITIIPDSMAAVPPLPVGRPIRPGAYVGYDAGRPVFSDHYDPHHCRMDARDYFGPIDQSATTSEESTMEAHLLRNERNRTTDIAIETDDGTDVFLNKDGEEVERKRGEEMPIYITLDDEVLAAIREA